MFLRRVKHETIANYRCYYVIDRIYYCTHLKIINEDYGELVFPVAVESTTFVYRGDTYSEPCDTVMLDPYNWKICTERKYVKKNVMAYFVEV